MSEYNKVTHPIEPFYDKESKILILGSFPSVKSREQMFFYGHPQNRFWKVLSNILEDSLPNTIEEKKSFLTKHHIALWDVIYSCEIKGSSDSSIKNVVPTDISNILKKSKISLIITNGKTSYKMYQKYQEKLVGKQAICLPSTSPANAAYSLDRLVEIWEEVLKIKIN